MTNTALRLVSRILSHGFGAAKGGASTYIGREAVARLMGMIMSPAQTETDITRDANYRLNRDIMALWKQMNVRNLDEKVSGAIREILKKFYVGAKVQDAKRTHDEQGKKTVPKGWVAWSDKMQTSKEVELEKEFDNIYGKLVPVKETRSEKTTETKRARKSKAKGRDPVREPAREPERVGNYYDVLADIARTVKSDSTVYVSHDTDLYATGIAEELSGIVSEAYVLLCTGHDAADLRRYTDLSDSHTFTILVVGNYGDARKYLECCEKWKAKKKAPTDWVYVAVEGAGDKASAEGMAKISSVVVGSAGAAAVLKTKQMIGSPTCEGQVGNIPVFRTYSDNIKFYNAPILDGKLSDYVGCAAAKLQVNVDGDQRDETHGMFVLRVSRLKSWETELELDTLLQLARQGNVHLVTTDAQHEAIVELQRTREREEAAEREKADVVVVDGDAPKRDRKQKTADAKRELTRGDKKGKNVEARRVENYDEVLWTMVNEAAHDAIIYVDPRNWESKKKSITADSICRYLAREFGRLVISSAGYESPSTPGNSTEYAEIGSNSGRVETKPLKAEAIGSEENKVSKVLLVVHAYKDAAGVTGCIAHVKTFLKWDGGVSWQTIVVGNGTKDDRDIGASLYVGSTRYNFSAKIEGEAERGGASSRETSGELRTFSDDLMLGNVPSLTPLVDEKRTVFGGLGLYVGSEYVEMNVERNGTVSRETPMVFVLRVSLLPDWRDRLPQLVTLAMQENVMLVTDKDQHDAIVGAYEAGPKSNPDVQRSTKKADAKRSETPAGKGTKGGSASGESRGNIKAAQRAAQRAAQDASSYIEPGADDGEAAQWRGPVKIMGKVWMYAEVKKAGCGESWRDLEVERENVTIKFLQVKLREAKVDAPHHAENKELPNGYFVYISCDESRNITGEYVSKTGGTGGKSKAAHKMSVIQLSTANEVSEKLGGLASSQLNPKLVVYVLCEQRGAAEGGYEPKSTKASPAKAMHGGGGIEVPWVRDRGKWKLWAQVTKEGTYEFDRNKMTILSSYSGTQPTKSRVVITKCDARASQLKPASSFKTMDPIFVKKGSVVREMQTKGTRHKVFVLPSQLNAAEYPNHLSIVDEVEEYIGDRTGGPAAQLAGDLGVAQFIIDNASNGIRPNQGIDNTRLMGKIKGITIENGYLKVDRNADVNEFAKMLPEMTILGVRDVPVRGLNAERNAFVMKDHTVDLIYASAVPFGIYTNPHKHDAVKRVANLTLLAQYTGAMRLAIQRGKCDLYLMPLGGGVFGNERPEIRAAILSARDIMKTELEKADVKIVVLAYGQDEYEFFKD